MVVNRALTINCFRTVFNYYLLVMQLCFSSFCVIVSLSFFFPDLFRHCSSVIVLYACS